MHAARFIVAHRVLNPSPLPLMESYSRDAPPTRETRPQNFFSLSSPPPPSFLEPAKID